MSNETLCSVRDEKLIDGIDTLLRDRIITVGEAREMLNLEPTTEVDYVRRAAE